MSIMVLQHDVPMITVAVCHRNSFRDDSEPNTVVRKFKANCGNTLEVHVTRKSGFIRSITPLDLCQLNCIHCKSREQSIRNLIATEHQNS